MSASTSPSISARIPVLAERAAAAHVAAAPVPPAPGGELVGEFRSHLEHLASAALTAEPKLFSRYLDWAQLSRAHRPVASSLRSELATLRRTLVDAGAPPEWPDALAILDAGLAQLADASAVPGSQRVEATCAPLARDYLDALLRHDRQAASRLILGAVQSGVGVRDIYLQVFQPVQWEIGRLWQINRISIAQEHFCTAATQLIISQLYPYLFTGERNDLTLVATCVAGELHEIGVRMVADFFEMEGWNTHYLGASMPAPDIVRTLAERRADVLCISTTLTTHLPIAADLIAAVRNDPATRSIQILVGGHAFSQAPELWRKLGADGFAPDAASAIRVARDLVGPDAAA